jgi:hypothetical protein
MTHLSPSVGYRGAGRLHPTIDLRLLVALILAATVLAAEIAVVRLGDPGFDPATAFVTTI